MPIKKVGSFAVRVAKNSVIGGAAGYLAGGFTGPSHAKEESAKQGAVVGALAGGGGTLAYGAAKLGAGKALRSGYGGLLKLSRKLGKNPGFDEGKVANAVAKSARKGMMTFRRIRGRLVPIRLK